MKTKSILLVGGLSLVLALQLNGCKENSPSTDKGAALKKAPAAPQEAAAINELTEENEANAAETPNESIDDANKEKEFAPAILQANMGILTAPSKRILVVAPENVKAAQLNTIMNALDANGFESTMNPEDGIDLRVEYTPTPPTSASKSNATEWSTYTFYYGQENLGAIHQIWNLPVYQVMPGTPKTHSAENIYLKQRGIFHNETVSMLKKTKVIMVTGMLTKEENVLEAIPPIGFIIGKNFQDQIDLLNTVGVANQRVEPDSFVSAPDTSTVIIDAIKESQTPVILMSHSKGGIDTLRALVKHPELYSKIKGWIAFQSPFAGSALFGSLSKLPILDSSSLLTGLSLENLQHIYHSKNFKRMLQSFPIYSVIGKTDPYSSVTGAVLPGSQYIVLDNAPGHASTVKGIWGTPSADYDRKGLTEALLIQLTQDLRASSKL